MKKCPIVAQILSGRAKLWYFLCSDLYTIKTDYFFEFIRLRFPIKLSVVTTIYKEQGQTQKLAGISTISDPCFTHGQFYVTWSQVIREKVHKCMHLIVENRQKSIPTCIIDLYMKRNSIRMRKTNKQCVIIKYFNRNHSINLNFKCKITIKLHPCWIFFVDLTQKSQIFL